MCRTSPAPGWKPGSSVSKEAAARVESKLISRLELIAFWLHGTQVGWFPPDDPPTWSELVLAYCCHRSSFRLKKCQTSIRHYFPPDSEKTRRGPDKTSRSKILKNPDDERLDHTQAAPRVVFWNTLIPQPNHWSLPVPIAPAHLPKCLRAEPSENIHILVPKQQRLSRTSQVWQGAPLSLQPCL